MKPLSGPQRAVLHMFHSNHATLCGESFNTASVAWACGTNAQGATRTLKSLRSRGYLIRRTTRDGTFLWRLSPAGVKACAEIFKGSRF